jgi:plastocyanin
MKTLSILLPAMIAATAILVACGRDNAGSSDNDATPQATATVRATQVAPTATATAGELQAPPTKSAAAPTSTPIPQQPVGQAPTQPAPPPAPTNTPVRILESQALAIVAKGTKFIPTQLAAASGSSITITYDNQDDGIAHDLIVYTPSGAIAAQTPAFAGVAQQFAKFTPGGPGNYFFKCSLHPLTMTGAINVQ